MSEIKLITPLLADHLMGDPISNHNGVRCCPAIQKDTENKYIVKILSIPASQVQLEALLLSGAFSNEEAALEYFKELADGVVAEAEVLRKLSEIEGFCSYEGWQVVPMEDGTGFDVYLLGSYKPTLERFYRNNAMTHLAAVNLGLDLCAALSVCRRCGYLYVALKPSNVFITANREFRIGDLGFIHLDSLKYASMPERYCSEYTAPEITDAYASLNSTLDVFSVGMILYQAYNNGQMPDLSQFPAQPLTPPMYADYEMAQIILKACSIDPADRWEDPAQMGQELVNYMQRNSVNDVPIVPPAEPIPEEPEDEISEQVEEASEVEAEASTDADVPADEAVEETVADEENTADDESVVVGETAANEESVVVEETADETEVADEPAAEPVQDEQVEEPEIVEEAEPAEQPDTEIAEPDETAEAPSEDVPEETIPENEDAEDIELSEDEFASDDTTPSEDILSELEDADVTDEVSAMLAQADELIAHKTPDPVIPPEPIDVPMPEPIVLTKEEDAQVDSEAEAQVNEAEEETSEEAESDAQAEESADVDEPTEENVAPRETTAKKRLSRVVSGLLATLIVLLLFAGAFFYYTNHFVQRVDGIAVSGEGTSLTVTLNTQIRSDLLTVYCTDTYGNKLQAAVVNNVATFTNLNPGTNYKVLVDISGFHKLVGTTTTNYTTNAQVTILNFTAVTGDQDGTVILNFAVQGQDNTAWRVYYSADGENEKAVDCSGRMASITGLTVGKVYTFRLVPVNDLYVIGEYTLEHTVSKVVYPQNLSNHGYSNGALHITWEAPDDADVVSWIVRCYNNSGYDSTFTVTEPAAIIEGLNPAESYTVDVKADGMSVSQWINISANSITFTDIQLDDSNEGELVITWTCEGVVPTDGWRLFYSIDGSEKYAIHSDTNTCTISPLLPGATYDISFDLPADCTVFGGTAQYIVPDTGMFDGYGVTWEDFNFRLCHTPDKDNWRWYDLYEPSFTNTFSADDKASVVLALNSKYNDSDDEIHTLFVIRDAQGNIVSITAGRTREWDDMWTRFNGTTGSEFDLPAMPQDAGEYTINIYFNNTLLTTQAFTVK